MNKRVNDTWRTGDPIPRDRYGRPTDEPPKPKQFYTNGTKGKHYQGWATSRQLGYLRGLANTRNPESVNVIRARQALDGDARIKRSTAAKLIEALRSKPRVKSSGE